MSLFVKKPMRNSPFTVHWNKQFFQKSILGALQNPSKQFISSLQKHNNLESQPYPRSSYLLRLSVGIAGMVDESGDISFTGGINEEVRLQCHEIEVGVLPSGIILPSSLELLGVQHLPNILHDKCPPIERGIHHL